MIKVMQYVLFYTTAQTLTITLTLGQYLVLHDCLKITKISMTYHYKNVIFLTLTPQHSYISTYS